MHLEKGFSVAYLEAFLQHSRGPVYVTSAPLCHIATSTIGLQYLRSRKLPWLFNCAYLADSPASAAQWVLGKFARVGEREWSNCCCSTRDHLASKTLLVLCVLAYFSQEHLLVVTLKGKEKGLSKKISVEACHSALLEGEHLLVFGKVEYTIHSAFVQGHIATWWLTPSSFSCLVGPCSCGDGLGNDVVKKPLVR